MCPNQSQPISRVTLRDCLIAFVALWTLLAQQTTAQGIAGSRHFRGLQATYSSTDGDCNDGTACAELTSTVSAGTLIQECTSAERTYLNGNIILKPADNVRSQPIDCCRSCFDQPGCNGWVFCDQEGGCPYPEGATTTPSPSDGNSDSAAIFPYQGCQLLSIPGFTGYLMSEEAKKLKIVGLNTSFVSGSLLSISLPRLSNYTMMPSSGVSSLYDFPCKDNSNTDVDACDVYGDPIEVAQRCNKDSRCKGFSYLPAGKDFDGQPMGVLKGGDDVAHLEMVALTNDPSSFLYIKHSNEYIETGTGVNTLLEEEILAHAELAHSCDSTDALWIILPTIAAVSLAFIAGIAAFMYYKNRRQKTVAVDKDGNPVIQFLARSSGGSGSGSGDSVTASMTHSDTNTATHDGSTGKHSSKDIETGRDQLIVTKSSKGINLAAGRGGVLVCRACGTMQPMGDVDDATVSALQSMGYLSRSPRSSGNPA